MAERIRVDIAPEESVTVLLYEAARDPVGICLVLAHGAGGSQMSGFMVKFAGALAGRGIDVATFNFLYSEQRKRVPDHNDKLELCWSRVIEKFRSEVIPKKLGKRKLMIGGKSMGGRIASQVAAKTSDGIAGLVFLGYPLHPPGRPEQLRSKHLPQILAPMLFVQGAKDAFGTPEELRPILRTVKAPAELRVVEGGDHSFKVAKSFGTSQDKVDAFVLDETERWLRRVL
jgi:predicted alpha/beta-hydrolase family hydrolase